MDALPRCVGCGEPTTSRTDDGRPKHVGCPDSSWSLTSAIGGAWTAAEADAIARAYAAGHRDGLVCGAESAGFGLVECEHVGRFALRPALTQTVATGDVDRLPAGLELENLLADWPHTINIEPRRAYLRQVAAHVLDVLREMGVNP